MNHDPAYDTSWGLSQEGQQANATSWILGDLPQESELADATSQILRGLPQDSEPTDDTSWSLKADYDVWRYMVHGIPHFQSGFYTAAAFQEEASPYNIWTINQNRLI